MTRAPAARVQPRPRPPKRPSYLAVVIASKKGEFLLKFRALARCALIFVYVGRGDAFPDKRSDCSGLQLIVIVNAS